MSKLHKQYHGMFAGWLACITAFTSENEEKSNYNRALAPNTFEFYQWKSFGAPMMNKLTTVLHLLLQSLLF